jgi:Holliday junction resolvase RusA-like endonuclease
MILLQVDGIPVPWAAHQGFGRRAFNPRMKERMQAQWQIKAQYNQKQPLCGPLWAEFIFHIPIPKATSKAKRIQMLAGMIFPYTRPDRTNYLKFIEDCLNGIVISDDAQIVAGPVTKIYSETPKTIIKLMPMNQYTLGSFPQPPKEDVCR